MGQSYSAAAAFFFCSQCVFWAPVIAKSRDGSICTTCQVDFRQVAQGGWEADETVEAAAARETVEEAGVRGVLEVPPSEQVTQILVSTFCFLVDVACVCRSQVLSVNGDLISCRQDTFTMSEAQHVFHKCVVVHRRRWWGPTCSAAARRHACRLLSQGGASPTCLSCT